jgi:two-component system OmpR family sensor kinase
VRQAIGPGIFSIRWRMAFFYLALLVVSFVAMRSLATSVVYDFFMSRQVQEVRSVTERIAVETEPYLSRVDAEGLYAYLVDEAAAINGAVLVLDEGGTVLMDASSRYNGMSVPYTEAAAVLTGGHSYAWSLHTLADNAAPPAERTPWQRAEAFLSGGRQGVKTVIYSAASITGDNGVAGAVILSMSVQPLMERIWQLNAILTLTTIIIAVIAVVFNFLVSGAIIRPVRSLIDNTRRIGQGDFSHRVRVRGRDELAQLASTFNSMTDKLEALDRSRSQFVSNASHELKTPLAAIKILAESLLNTDSPDPAMAREFLGDINAEVDRMSRLIEDLLTLVNRDEGSEMPMEPVNFSELVGDVMTKLSLLAATKSITLEPDLSPGITVWGDPVALEQMAVNLADNSIKYTPDRGRVVVSLRYDNDHVLFSVEDNGIGIEPEHLPHIFDRFYRVDKARSRQTGGTGLGLSIVKSIVQSHNGDVQVSSSPGIGTTMTVTLPLYEIRRGGIP